MRYIALLTIILLAGHGGAAASGTLRLRTLSSTPIAHQVIVGRAHCSGTTWLLTEVPELIRISVDTRAVSTSPVRGLRSSDKPWGLACLPNNELWTLASHATLAKLAADGRVVERWALDRPRLGIYSAGDQLLLQHSPEAVGRPLLASGPPTKLAAFVPWPAPLAQPAGSLEDQVRANLVSCGIGVSGYVPCWLTNQTRVAIGDGTYAHTTVPDYQFVRSSATATDAPVWDVALANVARVWVLASARGGTEGRRLGGRLAKTNRQGTDEGSIDLQPGARLILWATEDRCLLLSSFGQLMEVGDR